MASIAPTISPADRLSFTAFLAIAMHAALILGVTFTLATRGPSTHTMEVTLAQHQSDKPPREADFLAQSNQVGSGTLEKITLTTTTNLSDFQDTTIRDTPPRPEPQLSPPERKEITDPLLTTSADASRSIRRSPADRRDSDAANESIAEFRTSNPSLDIASLQARVDRQKQIHAKRPRIKRLTSLSTKASVDAFYLNSWRRKIETIGNLNYPEEARRRELYGSLRLLVTILPDGVLKEVEILESSGHQVLDDAAIRIVRLSAPFAPFPDELRQTTDVLEIIRTWQFRRNSLLSSF